MLFFIINSIVIEFAYYNGSSWTIEVIPSGYDKGAWVNQYLCLVLGADGYPRISHAGVAKNKSGDGKRKNPTLKYAIKNPSWSVTWIDGGKTDDAVELKTKGYYNSMAVGDDGKARVSYLDGTENKLMYAVEN